jgi:hypothetical protein
MRQVVLCVGEGVGVQLAVYIHVGDGVAYRRMQTLLGACTGRRAAAWRRLAGKRRMLVSGTCMCLASGACEGGGGSLEYMMVYTLLCIMVYILVYTTLRLMVYTMIYIMV